MVLEDCQVLDSLSLTRCGREQDQGEVDLDLHCVQGSAVTPVTGADNTDAMFDAVSRSSPRGSCVISISCLGSRLLIFLPQRHFPLGSLTSHSPVQIFLPSLCFIPGTP